MTSRITSAKASFLAIVTLSLGFFYFAALQIERNNQIQSKVTISALAAFRTVINEGPHLTKRALSNSLLADYSTAKRTEYFREYIPLLRKMLATKDEAEKNRIKAEADAMFGDQPSGFGLIYSSVPVHYSNRKVCDILKIRPSQKFSFVGFVMLFFPAVHNYKSDDISILIMDNSCAATRHGSYLIVVMKAENGSTTVGVPASIIRALDKSTALNHEIFQLDADVAQKLVPDQLRKFIEINEPLKLVDTRDLELLILGRIDSMTHRATPLTNIEEAISLLSDGDAEKTSVLGFSVTVSFFLRAIPVMLFGATFLYWRQLKRLTFLNSQEFWFPNDAEDFWGLVASYGWALTPALITLGVYFIYPTVFLTSLIIFDREITPLGVLTWDLPQRPAMVYYEWDYSAVLVGLLSMCHFILLGACTRQALKLSRLNRKVSFSGLSKRLLRRIPLKST